MNQIVPPKFQFRWSFFANKVDQLPHRTGRLLNLPDECALPTLGELDMQRDFAQIKLAWNPDGFGVGIEVTGQSRQPKMSGTEVAHPDAIGLWFDTRNTQTVHRATKFCHHFMIFPFGVGTKRGTAAVRALPVARAREENLLLDVSLVGIASGTTATGYWIDAWFPAAALPGFDPASQSRIGFQYVIRSAELGEQTLAVGSEFPYESDPSLWQTVELVG